jgi:hypothetical protein
MIWLASFDSPHSRHSNENMTLFGHSKALSIKIMSYCIMWISSLYLQNITQSRDKNLQWISLTLRSCVRACVCVYIYIYIYIYISHWVCLSCGFKQQDITAARVFHHAVWEYGNLFKRFSNTHIAMYHHLIILFYLTNLSMNLRILTEELFLEEGYKSGSWQTRSLQNFKVKWLLRTTWFNIKICILSTDWLTGFVRFS